MELMVLINVALVMIPIVRTVVLIISTVICAKLATVQIMVYAQAAFMVNV